ncbi:MAG: CarD family transcriptional regulator [Alphaproteobacteria bacterium]
MAHNDNFDFKEGDDVVYPAHGVGHVEGIETQTIAGMELSLYVVSFEKDRMRLKIPVTKAEISGLRKLSTNERLDSALETLKGRSRVRRTMWSRRAQEYATKINSGDPVAIAEVLRDLKRSNDDTEQSYSERQIYQSALERLAREVAAVDDITEIKATEKLEDIMGKIKSAPANIDHSLDDEDEQEAA